MQFGYRPQLRMPPPAPSQLQVGPGEVGFDGKMLRKAAARKTVDYNSSVIRYLENRIWQRDYRDLRSLQSDILYSQMITPPLSMADNQASCVMTKFIRAALNKDPRPINCVSWTPDGRRLITGASSGEFTLWNGLSFHFETILQAHNFAIRCMKWSNNEMWMLSGDDKGVVKYWQANMNTVHAFQAHTEAIRGVSFSPTDTKFATCADDRTVRIFDFVSCKEENALQGHGSDVKCVDWHPHKALLISGSKDSQQPIILWDARNAKKLLTIHAHKNTCTDLKWNKINGNWLISSSRDHLCKLFDIRNLKEEVQSFRGHKKDVSTIAWHPLHEKLFVSGGGDSIHGSLYFWSCGSDKELGSMEDAHESIVWDVSWHPMGHMLVSGSNDRSTRFWTRNRPGDTVADKSEDTSHSSQNTSTTKVERVTGIIFKNIDITVEGNAQREDGLVSLPGLGLEKELLERLKQNQDEYDAIDDADKMVYPPPRRDDSSTHVSQAPPLMLLTPATSSQTISSNIPGLDVDTIKNNTNEDDTRRMRNSQALNQRLSSSSSSSLSTFSKPIPKDFEKAWKSNGVPSNGQTSNQHSIPLVDQLANKNPMPIALMNIVPQILPGFQVPPPAHQLSSNNFQSQFKRKDYDENDIKNDDDDDRDERNQDKRRDDCLMRKRRQQQQNNQNASIY